MRTIGEAARVIIGNVNIFNELDFKTKSRQLDLLSRGDYSPIKDELAAAYPRTALPVRAIPFVQRYVAELSGLYSRAVVRRFAGTDLADPTWQKLQAVYTASKIDRAMESVEAILWTQSTAILLVLPDGLGKVRLQPLLPWQIDRILTSDAMRADDPATWTELVAQVPVATALGQVTYGRLVLTPTHAYRAIGGSDVGIYSPDKTHPFGRMPVVVAHRVQPDPGRCLAPVNEAVLNLQIALSLQQADNELIVRNCAFPQKWIRNANLAQQVEELTHGPDKFIALVRSGDPQAPAPELAIAQGQVPVAELVSFAEHQIRLYCAMLGLDPSAFLRVNTAVTAAARLFSDQDRAKVRDRVQPVLSQLEIDMAKQVAAVLELSEPMRFPPDLSVSVTWQPRDPTPDPQSAAQALKAEIELGVSAAADTVMARDGVTRTEANRTVARNLMESRAQGLAPPLASPVADAPAPAVP